MLTICTPFKVLMVLAKAKKQQRNHNIRPEWLLVAATLAYMDARDCTYRRQQRRRLQRILHSILVKMNLETYFIDVLKVDISLNYACSEMDSSHRSPQAACPSVA